MKTTPSLTARFGGHSLLAAAAILISLAIAPQTQAANATWILNADGNWATNTNWNPSSAPGATSGTTNTDIATFGSNITNQVIITNDTNRNIGGITFNYGYSPSAAGNGYSLKNELLVTSGGVIEEVSTTTPANSRLTRLQNDIRIQGSGAINSYTVRNDAASVNVRMFLNGVRVDAPASSATTLFLDGANTAPNTFGAVLQDGTAGATLAVVKNGTGYWRLTGPTSTYSGGTTVNAGRLQYNAGGGATSAVFGTGTLYLNGGILQNTESGTNVMPITKITNNIVIGGDFMFSTKEASYNTTEFSGAVNLGGATRTITVSGGTNSATILSGVISNGGITKTGVEKLVLSGHNTYTGNTLVSTGTLELTQDGWLTFDIGGNGTNNAILGTANVILDGTFSFNLTGADKTKNNSWNIVDVTTLTATWGGNFTVDGFTNNSGTWTKGEGLNTWTFKESTGTLNVVPEPSTIALLALGLGALLYRARRRSTRNS